MSKRGLLEAATSELGAFRARAAMSILSIVVGVAAVTLIAAVAEIGRSAVLAALERQSGREATIFVSLSAAPGSGATSSDISQRLGEFSRAIGANDAAASIVTDGNLVIDGQNVVLGIVGTDASLSQVRRLDTTKGRWLKEGDDQYLAPLVVLNERAAEEFGDVQIGSAGSVLLAGSEHRIRIAGVVADGESQATAYLPRRQLEGLMPPRSPTRLLLWLPPEDEALIRERLRSFAESIGVSIEWQRVDDPAAADSIIAIVAGALTLIAALSLVTGAIGIINVGLVTVQQRSREFAVRRAFGASASDIFTLVLLETAILIILGGTIGVAVAMAGSVLISWVASSVIGGGFIPTVPIVAALLGLAVSAALGFVVAIVPARSAMKKDVIQAIRD